MNIFSTVSFGFFIISLFFPDRKTTPEPVKSEILKSFFWLMFWPVNVREKEFKKSWIWAFFSFFFFHYSENYLVKWSSSGLVKDIDQLHNLRAVFTVGVSESAEVSVCVCVFVWWLFIQPCYEAFGSLFADGPCLLSSLSKILTCCLYLPRLSPRYNGGSKVGRVSVEPL